MRRTARPAVIKVYLRTPRVLANCIWGQAPALWKGEVFPWALLPVLSLQIQMGRRTRSGLSHADVCPCPGVAATFQVKDA